MLIPMGSSILTILSWSFCLTLIGKVKSEFIIDRNTAKELPIETHTYYAIQNQKTQKFLIWYGKNGTVDDQLDQSQSRFWHIFEKLDKGWYKMYHHFGSHTVKIGRSHEPGYYEIFNKDCYGGEHPNMDGDDRGTLMCNVVESGDLKHFNWKFYKKEIQTIPDYEQKPRHNQTSLKLVFPIVILAILMATIVYVAQRRNQLFSRSIARVIYTQDNTNFINSPVFPPPPPPVHSSISQANNPYMQPTNHFNPDPFKIHNF